MSDRLDRKAELERKKERLAQIRAAKQSKAAKLKEVGCFTYSNSNILLLQLY